MLKIVIRVEECCDAIVSIKITGGLSFRPENEAFIDIIARSNFIPIEGKITA